MKQYFLCQHINFAFQNQLKYPWIEIFNSHDKEKKYRFIAIPLYFLSQYCLWKLLVWRGPKVWRLLSLWNSTFNVNNVVVCIRYLYTFSRFCYSTKRCAAISKVISNLVITITVITYSKSYGKLKLSNFFCTKCFQKCLQIIGLNEHFLLFSEVCHNRVWLY